MRVHASLPSRSRDFCGEAVAHQDTALRQVSKTFALTIPRLPEPLRIVVANAYLLCRIADTIEDEPALPPAAKRSLEEAFLDAVTGRTRAAAFARHAQALLSTQTPEAERALLGRLPLVLWITHALNPVQRSAIVRCLRVMTEGMCAFQQEASPAGLTSLRELDRYCYCVAGVVGEMLTELIVDYEPALAPRRSQLLPASLSFGHGLQLANILKDQWEDRSRGICWLPQDVFAKHGVCLAELQPGPQGPAYAAAQAQMIGLAHAYLYRAVDYALMMPARHAGIRDFILWSIGLALVGLRHLHACTGPSRGLNALSPRSEAAGAIFTAKLLARHDIAVRCWFAAWSRPLPRAGRDGEWQAGLPASPHGPDYAPPLPVVPSSAEPEP